MVRMSTRAPTHPTEDPARGRGRPKKTPQENAVMRERLKQATALVYGQHGYHGLSVELILEAADLSRPTFYRHFRNADEPLAEVLEDLNDRLIAEVSEAIAQAVSPLEKVDAGLLAWRRWGERVGPLLRPIFAELYDAQSPNHRHRLKALAALTQQLQATARQLGRAPFSETQLEAFLFGIEHLGYRYHFGPGARTEAAWQNTRQAMIRLALGMLGSMTEWAVAPQIAAAMGVTLE